MHTPVDTKSCPHRSVRFASVEALLGDADRLSQAEAAGTLKQCGNWTLGQALNHVASWMDFPFDGYPATLGRPPWIIRLIVKPQKNKFIAKGLPRGVRIPGQKDGTVATEVVPTAQALEHLRRSATRLHDNAPSVPNPLFGPLSHDEWVQMNLRHAELHLGYFDVT